jgi:dihydroorotate dehydrogenase (NAD+) catalytic subunit
VRSVALAQVASVASAVAIPVIGMGGVQTASHARDLLDVGAALVAVGTESFRDPAAGARVARELTQGLSAETEEESAKSGNRSRRTEARAL